MKTLSEIFFFKIINLLNFAKVYIEKKRKALKIQKNYTCLI